MNFLFHSKPINRLLDCCVCRAVAPIWPFELKVETNLTQIRIQLVILDGYLISSNRVSYPIRALADGNFHNVHLNFKTRILHIDGQSPAISFDSSFLKDSIKQVDILVNGTATAIRLDNGDWHCNKSRYLTVKGKIAFAKIGFMTESTIQKFVLCEFCEKARLQHLRLKFVYMDIFQTIGVQTFLTLTSAPNM